MKTQIKQYAGVLLAATVVVGGIASAAITPIPTISNTFAVAGQVIKSADINKLAEALNILDARTQVGHVTSTVTTATVLANNTLVNAATITVDKTGWYELNFDQIIGDYSTSGQDGYTGMAISTTSNTPTLLDPSLIRGPNISYDDRIVLSHCFFGQQTVYLTAGTPYYVFLKQNSASGLSATLRAGSKIFGTYLGEE